ncbi:hypothetical protein G7046_g1021 [Stylonectria norvegica]|nr:hypothetical protein G7046_g1021 [Stylonectria norvegica]
MAKIIYSGSAGRIGFATDSKAFDIGSFTWFASMTKLMTTTCLMQLVEAGRIGLDDDLQDLIPEFQNVQILRGIDQDEKPILEANEKAITLRHLLTHTVGMAYDLADPDLMKWSKSIGRTMTCLDWDRESFDVPIKFAPGEGWQYGTALDWAGLVLEKVTGQKLGAYMQEHIFDPLGLQETGFWPEKIPQTVDRTIEYSYRNGEKLVAGPSITPKEHTMESGGAGLFSTARDYANFQRGFLKGELLKEETMKQMFTPQLNDKQSEMQEKTSYHSGVQAGFAPEFPTGLKLNHGLGGVLNMEDVPGKRRKGSLMWSGMCNSHWWIDRETGIAGCLVVNVLPHGDPVTIKLYNDLERAVYRLV